jgi:hypothetical protein
MRSKTLVLLALVLILSISFVIAQDAEKENTPAVKKDDTVDFQYFNRFLKTGETSFSDEDYEEEDDIDDEDDDDDDEEEDDDYDDEEDEAEDDEFDYGITMLYDLIVR